MRIVSRKVCQSTSLPSVHQYISTCDSIFNSRNSKAVIPVYKGRVKGFPSAARSSGYVIGGRILPEAWGWRLFLQTLHPTASGKEAFENENDRPVTHRTKRKIIRKVRARERNGTRSSECPARPAKWLWRAQCSQVRKRVQSASQWQGTGCRRVFTAENIVAY